MHTDAETRRIAEETHAVIAPAVNAVLQPWRAPDSVVLCRAATEHTFTHSIHTSDTAGDRRRERVVVDLATVAVEGVELGLREDARDDELSERDERDDEEGDEEADGAAEDVREQIHHPAAAEGEELDQRVQVDARRAERA